MGKKGQNPKKKNTITFRLVSRSQQDPLINYDDAPQAVLVEQKKPKDRKAEQRKYGIYYDDDYDYLQHLKGCEEVEEDYYFEEFDPKGTRVKEIKPKNEIEKEKDIIKLPSSVFPSQYQESVGMLNKGVLPTGPRPDWDQDVVGALLGVDHDEEDNEVPYDYQSKENELDDDFMVQAMGGELKLREDGSDDELDFKRKVQFEDDNGQYDDVSSSGEDERHTIRTVGSRSEFTNYSLTSSVVKRKEKLNDLDEHFETFFLKDIIEEEENDSEGSSDEEENETENGILADLINEHQSEKSKPEVNTDLPKKAILRLAERQLKDEDENREDLEEIELRLATGKNEYEDRWDCQSILSNYSNIHNRPKSIVEQRANKKIRINQKTGMPEADRLTEKGLKELNRQDDEQTVRSMASLISQLSVRNKGESKEEKQLRKKNLKELMRERRLEKKANKQAFKEMNLELNQQKNLNRQLAALKF